jgi:phosphoglycolate phosphatase
VYRYKLAAFDFDGTLVDSAPGIVAVMKQVVEQNGLPLEIWRQWSNLIGVPLAKQMEILFPDRDPEFRHRIFSEYRNIYDDRTIELCPPFPDLRSTLDELSEAGLILTIATSKRGIQVRNVLAHYNLSHYFKLVISAQDVAMHKPHPESILKTLELMHVDQAHTVVVGDSTYDLDMARAAAVDAIGVTTGVHSGEQLACSQPKHIVKNLSELRSLVLLEPSSGLLRTS